MEIYKYQSDILPRVNLFGKFEGKHLTHKRTLSDYVLYFVANGETEIYEKGQTYHLTKGSYLLLEANQEHYGTKRTECCLYFIHFSHPRIERLDVSEQEYILSVRDLRAAWYASLESGPFPENEISIAKFSKIRENTTVTTICAMFQQAIAHQKTHLENHNILCSCTVSEIFIELWRQYVMSLLHTSNQKLQTLSHLRKVISFLNTNHNRKITSAVIEKELSYNFDYLNQLFKKHLNISIFKMLENIRMETAKNLLQTQALSVKQTAQKVGYSDEAYFSKVFKSRIGVTPAKFRENGTKTPFR